MPGKKKYSLEVTIDGKVDQSLLNATNLTKRQLNALTKDLNASNKSFADQARKDFAIMDQGYAKIEKAVMGAVKTAAAGSAAFAAYSVTVGSAFEAQMSTVEAISGATAEQMTMLTDKAKQLGISTQFSATEAGKGMEYMAMAGWKTEQMLSGLPGILDLAAASGEELGAVSDIVTDDLTAFGMSADQAGRFADVLAAAATNANTNVALMGETFSYAAPLAGSMGYSVEDLAVATGLMANASIKGSSAGTALRNIMTRMAKPTKESAEAMKALGLSLTDDEGNMKSFMEIMEDMRDGFEGLSETEKAYYATELAGKQGLSGLLAIVNASEEDFDKLSDAITNSAGAARRMAAVRIDNLQGDVTLAKSAMEGLGIETYGVIEGPLRDFVQKGTAGIQNLTKEIQRNAPTIERELGEIADGMADFAGDALSVGQFFLKNPKVLTAAFAGVATMMGSYKLMSGMNALAQTVATFGKLGPVAHGTLGIVAVAGALAAGGAAYNAWYDSAKQKDLAEHFGEITLSADELDKALRVVVDPGGTFDTLDKAVAEIDITSSFKKDLDAAQDTIDKYKWKLSMGFELSDSESAEYGAAIQSYIDSANQYIKSHHYQITLGVKYLFGDNEEGAQWQQQFDDAYGNIESQLQHYSDQYSALKQRFGAEDSEGGAGVTVREQQMLDATFGNIMRITQGFETARSNAEYQSATSGRGLADADAASFRNFLDRGDKWLETEQKNADEVNRSLHEGGNISGFTAEQHRAIDEQTLRTNAAALARFVGDAASGTLINGTAYGADIAGAQTDIARAFGASARQSGVDFNDADSMASLNAWTLNHLFGNIGEISGAVGPGSVTKGAIGDMYGEYSDSVDTLIQQAQKLKEEYGTVPEDIQSAITDSAHVAAASGDLDAMYYTWAEQMQDSPGFQAMIEQAQELGVELPEGIARWLELNQDTTKDAASKLPEQAAEGVEENSAAQMDRAAQRIGDDFQRGLDQQSSRTFNFNPNISVTPTTAPVKHAEGGIFDTPHVGLVAEAGAEAIVPLNGSGRSMSIWEEAGRRLGIGAALERGNGISTQESSGSFIFAPNITIAGNASREDVSAALSDAQAEWEARMEIYLRNSRRVAFG